MGVSLRTRPPWRSGAAVTLLLGAAAVAGAESERDALEACRSIADDARRLACYDGVLLPETAPQPSAIAETAAVPEPPAVPDPPPVAPAPASASVKLARGNHRLTLEDGQVWREIEVKPRARYRVGDNVEIARGALGSYNLSNERTGHRIKVRRVR